MDANLFSCGLGKPGFIQRLNYAADGGFELSTSTLPDFDDVDEVAQHAFLESFDAENPAEVSRLVVELVIRFFGFAFEAPQACGQFCEIVEHASRLTEHFVDFHTGANYPITSRARGPWLAYVTTS